MLILLVKLPFCVLIRLISLWSSLSFFFRIENLIISHCTYILSQETFMIKYTLCTKERRNQEIALLYQVIILENLREGPHGVSFERML